MTPSRTEANPPAFVLHMGANGLGITRSLGREGIPVVGVDFVRDAPGLFSRYCRPLLAPNPSVDPKGALDALMREGEAGGGVLLPASDVYVLFVSRHRSQLSKHFHFVIPRENIVEGIVNKRVQYELAERIGVPIPRTIFPRSVSELDAMADRIQYPAFIKPCYSHQFAERFGKKGFAVRDLEELRKQFALVLSKGLEAMVQEIVEGPETNLYGLHGYFDRAGEPLALYMARKIRQYPPDFGVGTVHESAKNAEVRELGLKFFQGLGYTGMGGVEFKRDRRDGRFKLIELNPRTGMQNLNMSAAGLNMQLIRCLDALGRRAEPRFDYREGVRWVDLILDLESLLIRRKRGEKVPSGEVLRTWITADCHPFLSLDDLRPAAARTGGASISQRRSSRS